MSMEKKGHQKDDIHPEMSNKVNSFLIENNLGFDDLYRILRGDDYFIKEDLLSDRLTKLLEFGNYKDDTMIVDWLLNLSWGNKYYNYVNLKMVFRKLKKWLTHS